MVTYNSPDIFLSRNSTGGNNPIYHELVVAVPLSFMDEGMSFMGLAGTF
jgi:hypothetical protein